MSKISVIIPTYNLSIYLKEAIESVLKQTYRNFEILVIDDGSTDDTRNVVEKFIDPRVKYFYKENRGHCSARNYGTKKANGEFLAFLDHDDLWSEKYLEKILNTLEKNKNYSAAYGRVLVLSGDGSAKPFAREERYISGWITEAFFKSGPCIMPSATLFRKEILQGFYFDEALRSGEDNDYFMRLSLKTRFLFVSDAIIYRREVPSSLSKNISVNNLCNGILSFERFYYKLGGNKIVNPIIARKSISHKYRRAGKECYKRKCKKATIILFKKAIKYYPLDIRLYSDIIKTMILNKNNDPLPNWKMPRPLPEEVTIHED